MRSPVLASLGAAAAALAFPLAPLATAQNHSGVWDLSPPVQYFEGGGCPDIFFDQLYITDAGTSVVVNTNSFNSGNPGTMFGGYSGSSLIRVTSNGSGGCGSFLDYTLELHVDGTPSFTGTFRIDGGGFPCFCPTRFYSFNVTLQDGTSNYCTPGTSASGCQATLSTSGLPSASQPSGFVVSAQGVEGAKNGIFFFGVNGRQAKPWGSGTSYQCVAPPVMRGGLLAGTGTPGLCDGSASQDLNARWCATCPRPLQNPGAGALVQLQLWCRDPLNTSNQTTSLSRAIEFTVWP